MKKETAVEKAKALEEIAEFIVDNYEHIPSFEVNFSPWLSEWRFDNDQEACANAVKELALSALSFGWDVDKDYDTDHMKLDLTPIHGGKVQFWVQRETVCTKKVLGTETITRKVAIGWEEEEVEQEIVEWECKPLLGIGNEKTK